ncbi:MAG: prepilin-type N-terminal cleavage/methylation domain-containing protein [Desulfobacterales bacterium]|nr:MAG: prepilin-type N-terminal cleavage/methylation domain-containing protein [Desulfobacterales bacterium]
MMDHLKTFSAPDKSPGLKTRLTAGFTVIEVLMVMAILSIAFGTIYKSFEQLNRSYTTENVKAGIQQGARIAVELMVQDIRLAGLDPLGTANAGFAAGISAELPTTNWIEFTTDVNFDGDVDTADDFENIKYELVGSELKQTNHLGTETMLDNVTNLTFTYLDSDDQTTTDINEIRSVIVSLTMEKPAGRAEPVSRTYTTKVRCRNL